MTGYTADAQTLTVLKDLRSGYAWGRLLIDAAAVIERMIDEARVADEKATEWENACRNLERINAKQRAEIERLRLA